MSVYCPNCGAAAADGVNYCPQCGAAMNGSGTAGMSDAAKTAAVVGGAVLGVSALNNLARRLGHRRRPMYFAPPPREPRGPHGPGFGGPGGPHGPGGRF